MSASRLAKHVGVDVATVTRFAQQIGYEGYLELSREIQDTVLKEMERSRQPVLERLESAEGVFKQTLWQDWANMEKTIQGIRAQDADRAVEALRSAQRIFFVAEGAGRGLACAAEAYLKMIKQEVYVLDRGPFDLTMELKDLGPEDLVIGIGFTNYAFGATRALKVAQAKGASTIALVGQAACPVGKHADILFAGAATEEGYLPSITNIGAILFALIFSIYMNDSAAYNRELISFQTTYADLTGDSARGQENVVEDLLGRF
jgi:DNA-binding MurR/RpiR family transcriptional regulator